MAKYSCQGDAGFTLDHRGEPRDHSNALHFFTGKPSG